MVLITLFVVAWLIGSVAPTVPTVQAAPADAPPEVTARVTADTVNINTADITTLMTLSGVGRKLAEKIVEYRTSHGPFKKAEDVRRVEGLGPGLWERNRERIVIK